MKHIVSQLTHKINCVQQNQYPEFTDFLDLYQQRLCRQLYTTLPVDVCAIESQVFADDERRMIGLFPKSYLEFMTEDTIYAFPLSVIKITMGAQGSIAFDHRALLGALLGQGIDRRLLGDIILTDHVAYVTCHERIAPLLCEELLLVSHHSVCCNHEEDLEILQTLSPQTNVFSRTIPSLRLDNVLHAMLGQSRTECQNYILRGKVRVNQEEITKSHYMVEENAILSVRGFGKFKLKAIGQTTKKGRIWITLLRYI